MDQFLLCHEAESSGFCGGGGGGMAMAMRNIHDGEDAHGPAPEGLGSEDACPWHVESPCHKGE